jgi:diguanylate cyclase
MEKVFSKSTMSRWRAIFNNTNTEEVFRQQSASLDSTHTARGLLLLAAANVIFFLGDLEILTDQTVLSQFAASRAAFLLSGLIAYLVLRTNLDPVVLDRTILIFAIVGTILMTFQLSGYLLHAKQPPALFDIMLIYLIVTPATYLLLANPLVLQLTISAILTVSFVYVLQFDIPQYEEQLPFAITFLVLVNIIGIATSSRRHELSRRAWWLLNEERSARKRLENEINLRQSLEQELRHMATTDELTEISNRRHFYARAEAELTRARRYGRSLTLLMFDLDNFKHLNDTHGHPFGDLVLKSVAASVSELLRASDLFGRIGGEEFAIALPETTRSAVPEISERIRQTIEDTVITLDGSQIKVTASIGVTLLTASDENLNTVMNRADQAMYEAKENGRNKVVFDG